MNYYKIDVVGKDGYSFMVCSNDKLNECEAIDAASQAGLFIDADDAHYAVVDDIVSQQDIDHFIDWGCCHQI